MEDRNLQRKKSLRRKNRIKSRKKGLIFRRLLVVLVLIALIYIIIRGAISLAGKLMKDANEKAKESNQVLNNNTKTPKEISDDKIVSEEGAKLSLEDEKEKEKPVVKKPIDTEITLEKRNEDLKTRINKLLQENKVNSKNLSIGYFNLDNDEGFAINEEREFGLGRSNDFMIAMAVYDIAKESKLDLDQEIELKIGSNENKDKQLTKKYSIRELIKLMIQLESPEAKKALTDYIEDKTAKYWYDEINSRYAIKLSYQNKMNNSDAMKVLRRLFSQSRLTAKEKTENKDKEKKFDYQELINFMTISDSSQPVVRRIMDRAQLSENFGNDSQDGTLMGFVLGQNKYIYVIMTGQKGGRLAYDSLATIEEWRNYYNN